MAIRDEIAKYAYEAADKFVRHKIAMNDTIKDQASKNSLNSEVIKRICEEANKNVYLALFKAEGTDKTKIEFPRAEDNVIMSQIKSDDSDIADYILPPGASKPVESPVSSVPTRDLGLTNSRDTLNETLNKVQNMLASIRTMLQQEKQASEKAYQHLYGSLKKLAHTETFGDICKLAMRYTSYAEMDMKAASEILKYAEGHLKQELKLDYSETKLASSTLNPTFPLFKEFEECVRGIEKVAGLTELEANFARGAATIEGAVTGKGIEKNAEAKNLYIFMKEYCK